MSAEQAAARFAATAPADVAYAVHDSPLGPLVLARTRRGLARIGYGSPDAVLEDVAARVSPRILEQPARLDDVRRELDDFFASRLKRFTIPLDLALSGPGFARSVLMAARRIPYGETASYAEVAARAGSPRAFRAAGTALGRNPVPIVVPCHRVLPSTGALGSYTGGVQRKAALLEVERRGVQSW